MFGELAMPPAKSLKCPPRPVEVGLVTATEFDEHFFVCVYVTAFPLSALYVCISHCMYVHVLTKVSGVFIFFIYSIILLYLAMMTTSVVH